MAFPAVLRVDSEPPFKFQEALRIEYPIYKEEQTTNLRFNFPPDANPPSNPFLLRGRNVYKFSSEDLVWTITLTRDFIAISTTAYARWENFKEHFENPLKFFVDEYNPPFYTRVGLRYIDLIDRANLGLQGVSWRELLKPHIAGELSSVEVGDRVLSCANQAIISLDDESRILLNHGLVNNNGNNPDNFSYLIDCDFSTDKKTEINNVNDRIDHFNQHAGRLFRWCIADRLHDALVPHPI